MSWLQHTVGYKQVGILDGRCLSSSVYFLFEVVGS